MIWAEMSYHKYTNNSNVFDRAQRVIDNNDLYNVLGQDGDIGSILKTYDNLIDSSNQEME